MADNSDDKLFQALDQVHPDYVLWLGEWDRYRDVLGDVLVEKSTYLPRNAFEPSKQYDFRLELTQFIPESGLAIQRLLGGLYTEKPKRDLKSHETDLKDFMDKATKKGESFNAAMKATARNLLGYGTTRVLVNVSPAQLQEVSTPDGSTAVDPTVTRADEKEQGIRPFLINYGPHSVRDWEHDDEDQLVFVRIKEERTAKAEGEKIGAHLKTIKFIEYDRQDVRWWIFQEDDEGGDMKLVSAAPETTHHGLGVVPMVIQEMDELKPMIGQSFIRYSSKADIRKLQAESDLAYDTYMHAHPFLAIWTEEELAEVGVGTNSYLKLNPGAGGVGREDAKYIDAPSTAFDSLRNLVEDARIQIFRQAKVDPMGQVTSADSTANFQASGVSRAWSFGTSEARSLSEIADVMEQVEAEVFEIYLRWIDSGKDHDPDEKIFKGDIQYPEEFDMSSTAQLLEERAQIGQLVNSPTLLKQIDKRIAASKVGDASAKILREIQDEIETNPLLGTMAGKTKDPFQQVDVPVPGEPAAPPGGEEPTNGQPKKVEAGPPPVRGGRTQT